MTLEFRSSSEPRRDRLAIRLTSGRGIYIDSIHLSYTYGGMLEGGPDDRANARVMRGIGETSRARFGQSEHVVIPPRFATYEAHGRVWKRLPPIEAIARFNSDSPARDERMDWSSLVIGWFQQSFEPIVAPEVRGLIEELDWNSLARDCDW